MESLTLPQSTTWSFPLYFQLPYLPEETCFQQVGSSAVEGTSQDVLGSFEQRKVPASMSLFLKSEKIPALLYVGKGPSTGPSAIFDLFPWPTGLGHRSQITKGPILRPFSYTQNLLES
jgi:hypothetical protein